jgi:hypothetical protein
MKKFKNSDLAKAFPNTYAAWEDMWARCTDPNHPSYPEEGGKGIRVCQQWKSFATFLNDVGPSPDDV